MRNRPWRTLTTRAACRPGPRALRMNRAGPARLAMRSSRKRPVLADLGVPPVTYHRPRGDDPVRVQRAFVCAVRRTVGVTDRDRPAVAHRIGDGEQEPGVRVVQLAGLIREARASRSESSRRAMCWGSTRRIFADAVSFAVSPPPSACPAAGDQAEQHGCASSSLSMSGGKRYPGLSRYRRNGRAPIPRARPGRSAGPRTAAQCALRRRAGRRVRPPCGAARLKQLQECQHAASGSGHVYPNLARLQDRFCPLYLLACDVYASSTARWEIPMDFVSIRIITSDVARLRRLLRARHWRAGDVGHRGLRRAQDRAPPRDRRHPHWSAVARALPARRTTTA